MDIINIRKKLKSLIGLKLTVNLENLEKDDLIKLVLNKLNENDLLIEKEILLITDGEINNIEEYYIKYKDYENKPSSYPFVLHLFENNLLLKILTELNI